MPSNIHVFVRFKDQCVFAGEELNCTITFKNVAGLQENTWRPNPTSRHGSFLSGRGGAEGEAGPTFQRRPSMRSHLHRSTMSLSMPAEAGSTLQSNSLAVAGLHRAAHTHRRSVSIISIGSVDSASGEPSKQQRRPPYLGHSRSSTVQVLSGIVEGSAQTPPADSIIRNTSHQRELLADPPSLNLQLPDRGSRRSPLSASASPSSLNQSRLSTPDFPPQNAMQESAILPESAESKPANRIISETATADSGRSSTDIYSNSNHSQETFMSEQVSLVSEKPQFPSARIRQHYRMDSSVHEQPHVEKILMGYAQINATFTLDSSLVDQTPFEEIKRKGFLGGQGGGGVVGVKTSKATGGLLGGFSLNSIGESIGGLLGGADMSSVKEMKAVAASRQIPLLSIPQSLLFVDLQLDPGEEKSFSFAYTLPRGLPSSHRGKAIKIVYNLTVGIQIPPSRKNVQSVRQVNIPIRVFSGVNSDGEIFGHDLMQPHVILRDSARTASIEHMPDDGPAISSKQANGNASGFLNYVDELLSKNRRRQSSSGMLEAEFFKERIDGSLARQAINRAILMRNQASMDPSSNRFDIARNGLKVAVVVLNRSLLRLGETVTGIVDFNDTQVHCMSLRATLETTEKVNPSLALRSDASINRVTRKVYAAHSENVLFVNRAVFNLSVPVTATPTLLTSGVNLDWTVRLEFTTKKTDEEATKPSLLEEIVKDERGIMTAAVEVLDCETFEAIIPLCVYGDVVANGKDNEAVVGIPI